MFNVNVRGGPKLCFPHAHDARQRVRPMPVVRWSSVCAAGLSGESNTFNGTVVGVVVGERCTGPR